VTSCDIHPHKIELIQKGADRLGLGSIHPLLRDAREFEPAWENAMDAVIADVPCSGLGVIRKKPDVRYKDLTRISELPDIQLAILDRQAAYVRPGGVLIYSTCTVLKRENEGVVEAFLDKHPEFAPEPITLPEGCPISGAMITLLPCVHDTDGFFIAKLRKKP
ncbi:MAG: 16S rRNA (cytosine(967)-C(5))-methyltransferase RsmB, partial [Oscillospiraceae bacterium]|nr:16S rRNA (cytosine(967)-C(5))-methyltransferase RsmB [Oscillospiraceae bacterium]